MSKKTGKCSGMPSKSPENVRIKSRKCPDNVHTVRGIPTGQKEKAEELEMEDQKKPEGRKRKEKPVDMDYVYGQIDTGRTEKEVARELGVSVSTLQRRHRRYQREAKEAGEKNKEMG